MVCKGPGLVRVGGGVEVAIPISTFPQNCVFGGLMSALAEHRKKMQLRRKRERERSKGRRGVVLVVKK